MKAKQSPGRRPPHAHAPQCPEPGRPSPPLGGLPGVNLGHRFETRVAGSRPAPGRASSAEAAGRRPRTEPYRSGSLDPGGGRWGRRPAAERLRPRRPGAGGGAASPSALPRVGPGAGGPEGLRRLEKGPSAAPHRAARPRARCGRRAIHTPSGHSARRGGGGRRFNGDFAGRRRGWGRGPAAGAARCYAVAAGPAARARRPHYAGNAV